MTIPASAYALLAANLLPLVMAAGGNWGIREILPLYWFESAIIGSFNILKILLASGTFVKAGGKEPDKNPFNISPEVFSALGLVNRVFTAAFFTFHFGMFMFVHGVFLFGVILGGGKSASEFDWLPALLNVKWGVLALFCSHAASFLMNYIGGGEFRTASPGECMAQPYSRIIVMHLTILLGAFVSFMFKDLSAVMVIFVALKIFVDFKAHLKERAKAAAPAAATRPPPETV
ncbi:MAG TPA: hypothetical protein DCZ92_00140 [Elusimicrobia bacterium]|nr:MAG: hypothetical protein A2016_01065 [Elusimicrobia bacterium GWF2_62_30]HBA59236.1 hypothetical protein [Elusimicrobiota bacterium]